ncbi:MAG: PLP-dependent aminotransferase family protein [Trueperella sp.]|nr:PLP-dependent aminotransferase family protein [Trueperella sp.]
MARLPQENILPITLNQHSSQSLPEQIAAQIRAGVATGSLVAQQALPSTRQLAEQLGVARGTVVNAYEQLQSEGYVTARPGGTTRISPELPAIPTAPIPTPTAMTPQSPQDQLSLRPGQASRQVAQDSTWRSAWRQAASLTAPEIDIRPLLARHMQQTRSVVATNIELTGGGRAGFAAVLIALEQLVGRKLHVGFEFPGIVSLRQVASSLGHRVVRLHTDTEGVVPEALPHGKSVPDLVVVTPSHQYPVGGSLPAQRRFALMEWARTAGCWIVEDDYDSELRHATAPLPALAAIDDAADPRVIFLGSFRTLLTPAVRAGWITAPTPVFTQILRVQRDTGVGASAISRRALAWYLHSGHLPKHTRRMRKFYRGRLNQLQAKMSPIAGVEILGKSSGLNAALQTTAPEQQLVSACAAQQLEVVGMGEYWGHGVRHNGLMLGFGGGTDAEFEQALAILGTVLAGDDGAA